MRIPRPVVGVGVIVERADGRILLGRRVKPHEPQTWCLPGGHLEARETIERAGERECFEEAGIDDLTATTAFTVVVDTGPSHSGVVFGVHAHSHGDPSGPGEPQIFPEWIWVDPTDLPHPLFPASNTLLRVWTGSDPGPAWQVLPVTASG